MYIKQLLNSVLVGNEELLRPRFMLSAEAELKIYLIHIKVMDTMFSFICANMHLSWEMVVYKYT